MAKAVNRELVTLECTICNKKNYRTSKNKKNTTVRLELKKYCRHCRKVTIHREEK